VGHEKKPDKERSEVTGSRSVDLETGRDLPRSTATGKARKREGS